MTIRPLSPELAEIARKELNEDPKRTAGDIRHMKDWIAKQPHLRARTDDQWILAFLRGCKFSLERTKEKFDLYYSLKTTAPDIWAIKYNETRFMEILELGAMLILPVKKNVIEPRVILIRTGCYDANKYHISEIMSVAHVIQEISKYEDDTWAVVGGTTILDLEGVNAVHFMQMTPTQRKKMVIMAQDATPVRMKGTHFINTPTGFETIFNLMKALMKEKNRSRLFVHNRNYDEMYKYISKDVLPIEYGGNNGTIRDIVDHWKNKVKEYSSWLKEDWANGTDESKRPGKPKTAESMFGVEGSFRQLHID